MDQQASKTDGKTSTPDKSPVSFEGGVIALLPYLRNYGRSLARNTAMADDLVQETVLRALSNRDKFVAGTNLKAWLSTILRNQFFNELRCRSRAVAYIAMPRQTPFFVSEQETVLEMRDFTRAFQALPAAQREALTLVGASGYSYEEAAAIAGCAMGTMKSRVCRARHDLEQRLDPNPSPLEPRAAPPILLAA